jgi:mannose-6-phosphate isomerase-like protein (cupin superfamily)
VKYVLSLGEKSTENMLIKDRQSCAYFRAVDHTLLCELLHPARETEALALRCSIAHAIVKPGETTLPHRLKSSAEVYYILEGEGIILCEHESARIHSGQAIYIPPTATQQIHNPGSTDLEFLCIVDPMWRREDEEVVESAPQVPSREDTKT